MRSDWENALKSRKLNQIVAVLLNGYVPEDFSARILIQDEHGAIKQLSIVEAVLSEGVTTKEHLICAGLLFSKGAPLPSLQKNKEEFVSTKKYLNYLGGNFYDLFITAYQNPDIFKLQDENGQTILHYAAKIGLISGYGNSLSYLKKLFQFSGIDFTIQDDAGNTALHIVAFHCSERTTYEAVFECFVSAAVKQNFNFNILNNDGQAVIHLAARFSYLHPAFMTRGNTIKKLLTAAKYAVNVDTLSSSGSSALFYAINNLNYDAANSLLDAGANPNACGNPARNPFAEVNKNLLELAANEDVSEEIKRHHLEKLELLQQRMIAISDECEIRKAAKLLGQVARNRASIFSVKKVPLEILSMIAASTTRTNGKTEKEREAIAREYLRQALVKKS